MKQQINPKQLKELSKKGKEKLREWCKKKNYCFEWWKGIYTKEQLKSLPLEFSKSLDKNKYTDIPLLSIGQMIDFLSENDYINLQQFEAITGKSICTQFSLFSSYRSSEFCDSLWDVVKTVLEK